MITHIEAYKKIFEDAVHLCINPQWERAMIDGHWIPLGAEEALMSFGYN